MARFAFRLGGVVFSLAVSGPAPAFAQEEPSAVERGQYIFRATGGCGCHTDYANDGAFLAGGRAIETPFGAIYGTNITPDTETGIGGWSDEDFLRAMTEGIGPDGTMYYPVFPYTAFTKMTREDVLDLKAYLFSVPPVKQENKPPELGFPFSVRAGLTAWRLLNFEAGTFEPLPEQSPEWNRGAYITHALAHCGECHTPRGATGALNEEMHYGGSKEGPEGELAPNITPDEKTGIGTWSAADITWFLQTGFEPGGDDAQGLMREVIDHGYQYLEASDLQAISTYLKSLTAIQNEIESTEP
ncbi:MAG: c-type cytochrome [Vicinamibacteria bacterium]